METTTQPDLSAYSPRVQALCKAMGWAKPPEVSPARKAELDAAMAAAQEYATRFYESQKT